MFTPLDPVPSGISFYSEELLPILARALDIDVFVDGYAPTHGAALARAGVRVRGAREFARAARVRPYGAIIYQLGNSPAHAYMYERALRDGGPPGLVVLHDVVLHHLRLWMAVSRGGGGRREYAADLARLYGKGGEEVARAVLRGQTPPALFDFPLVEPVLDAARVTIVHNRAAAGRLRELRPKADVRVVPMGVPLPALPPRDEARARLGVAPGSFLVVSHGHATPYKRLDVALRAFRRLLAARPDACFLLSGSEAPNLGLERLIGYLGLGDRVRRLGFVPEEGFADLLAAADCCINLRYPSAGETSASLLRIMGAGLPPLVTDAGSFRELPSDCCVKIPVGPLEEPLLAEYLTELARNEPLRAALGGRARAFVAAEHSLERSAAGYLDALGALLGRDLALSPSAATPAPLSPPIPPPSPRRRGAGGEVQNCSSTGDVPPAAGATAPAALLDPLLDGVADVLADLGLAGHEGLERSVARDLVALGSGGAVEDRGQRRSRRGEGRQVRGVGLGRRIMRRARERKGQ